MNIKEVKNLIVGSWDVYTNPEIMGRMDRYIYDHDNEEHKGSHARDIYTTPYFITEKEGAILLRTQKTERELYAVNEKCMVWKIDAELVVLLRIL